jgi:Transposase DDE domain
MLSSFYSMVRTARSHKDLYFAGLLTAKDIHRAFGQAFQSCGVLYTPLTTVTVFLTQALSSDHSCREAVTKLLAWRLSKKLPACSVNTGGYCVARDGLPEEGCAALAKNIGRDLCNDAPKSWLWKGREVRVVDGSTVKMPGSDELLEVFPQESQQKPGVGFPIARILVVFSLAVGSAIEMAIGPYKGKLTGETSMFRQLLKSFSPGEVVLADRAFSGWFDMALCIMNELDIVIRMNASRKADFRKGRRLGKDDHIIKLTRPARPKWMTIEEYQTFANEIELREVRIHVCQKGFRSKTIIVHTTLVDVEQYTKEDIGQAFRQRWNAEINMRSIKNTMQMEYLRCKTPHRIRNEFYINMVAYNLIRRAIALAAIKANAKPWQVSFKGAMQTLNCFLSILTSQIDAMHWCDHLLLAIATHEIGNRPDRFEPRVVKRRPKPYPRMMKPRAEYKNQAA